MVMRYRKNKDGYVYNPNPPMTGWRKLWSSPRWLEEFDVLFDIETPMEIRDLRLAEIKAKYAARLPLHGDLVALRAS